VLLAPLVMPFGIITDNRRHGRELRRALFEMMPNGNMSPGKCVQGE